MTVSAEDTATQARANRVGDYAIAVEGMGVRYGGTPAVRDLSMHVPPASIYGLVGPSGAGKSTAIRVLATLQQPDTGAVFVDGVDVRLDPASARFRVGYLPDFFGLYESLTVAEYLDFYAAVYGLSPGRRRRIIGELLELIGLTNRRDEQVKSLSRGMRQKLGLARCLVHDPQILLLDEPASGMDPLSRLDLRDMLQELARLRKTILISSHMLSELAEVCSHLGIMRAGELIAEGPVDDIVRAVFPFDRVRVQLLRADEAETARQILQTLPTCHDVEIADTSTLVVRMEGTREDLAAILSHLSAGDVQVTELAVERPTLEDMFLRVMKTGDQG